MIPPDLPHTQPLWGELDSARENVLDLSPMERESLMKLCRPLTVEGPKFHSPLTRQNQLKREPTSDPIVDNTIELLEYKRVLQRLLDTVSNHKAAIAAGSLDKMPSLQPAPELPVLAPRENLVDESGSSGGGGCRVMEVGGARARQLLEDSVIKLSAHAGYQTANSSAVMLLTDATSHYLKTFCSMLRRELDTRLEAAPTDSHGWDALEKVCVEMKVGTEGMESHKFTVLALADYYRDSVISRQERLLKEVKQLTRQYEAGTSSWGQDDIPQMHFPSSEEGVGVEQFNYDHATPTGLDVGMQMLQSLEAGGELVETPSPGYNVDLDSNVDTPSPSPGQTKKRRMESGHKY